MATRTFTYTIAQSGKPSAGVCRVVGRGEWSFDGAMSGATVDPVAAVAIDQYIGSGTTSGTVTVTAS